MRLVERGQVSLDSPVARYLPEFQADGEFRFTALAAPEPATRFYRARYRSKGRQDSSVSYARPVSPRFTASASGRSGRENSSTRDR